MTAPPDHQRSRRRADLGHHPVNLDQVAGPGDEIVHPDAHHVRGGNGLHLRPEAVGQFAQHPQGLTLLLDLRFPQGVAQINGFRGLDEQGATTGRFVVDDAVRPVPRVTPDGDDVSPAPHGDRALPATALHPPKDGLQLPDQPVSCGLDLAPGGGQPGTRRVEEDTIGVQRAIQQRLEAALGHRPGERGTSGGLVLYSLEFRRYQPGRAQRPAERDQFRSLQYAALDPEPGQGPRDIRNPLSGDAFPGPLNFGGLTDHRQFVPDPGDIDRRPPGPDPVGPEFPGRERCDPVEHQPQLQGFQRVGGILRRE